MTASSAGQRAISSAPTKINRADFGLHGNQILEAGDVLVEEEIKISIELEAARQAPAA